MQTRTTDGCCCGIRWSGLSISVIMRLVLYRLFEKILRLIDRSKYSSNQRTEQRTFLSDEWEEIHHSNRASPVLLNEVCKTLVAHFLPASRYLHPIPNEREERETQQQLNRYSRCEYRNRVACRFEILLQTPHSLRCWSIDKITWEKTSCYSVTFEMIVFKWVFCFQLYWRKNRHSNVPISLLGQKSPLTMSIGRMYLYMNMK